MSADDPFREFLRERVESESVAPPRRRRRRLTDDQAARLLDAAAAVLAATKGLVSVGEQILRERRDGLLTTAGDHEGSPHANGETRKHIDLTY